MSTIISILTKVAVFVNRCVILSNRTKVLSLVPEQEIIGDIGGVYSPPPGVGAGQS